MSDPKEIVVHAERSQMVMVASPAEMVKRQNEVSAFVKSAMTASNDGTGDYGLIPGAGDHKVLFKAGAEKLCALFNLAAEYVDDGSVEDWTNNFFHYKKRCRLTLRDSGIFVGESIGSCNSREKKYAGRWVPEVEVPTYLPKETLKQRKDMVWLFDNQLPATISVEARKKLPMKSGFSKKTNKRWESYGIEGVTFFVPNDDICSLVNTIEKMAAKRAYVSAVSAATRVSGLFDGKFSDEDFGEIEDTRSWEQREADDAKTANGMPATGPVTQGKNMSAELKGLVKSIENIGAKAVSTDEINLYLAENRSLLDALSEPEYQIFKDETDRAWAAIEKRMKL